VNVKRITADSLPGPSSSGCVMGIYLAAGLGFSVLLRRVVVKWLCFCGKISVTLILAGR